MKIGLILPGNKWFCPYAKIYTDILEKKDIEYEVISWNRDGSELDSETTFNSGVLSKLRWNKLTPFYKYVKFIKSLLLNKKYDKIIVFGPQLGILLFCFLRKHFYKKFIFDYRDLSIEQLPFLKIIFRKVLNISSINIISSPGFVKFLPKKKFIISHNFNVNLISTVIKESSEKIFDQKSINILTIGSIRDYEANLEVVKSLSNKEKINLYFVGKGSVSDLLKKYVEENKIKNVFFYGFYEKNEEESFIREATFLNIYYPKIKSHSSAMSNRFYNAIIYKRPMIVTSNSIQGQYVEEYKLGLSIKNCENLYDEIIKFKKEFNCSSFDNNSNSLLNIFKNDYDEFYNNVVNFLLQ